jgi:hypothetical protein
MQQFPMRFNGLILLGGLLTWICTPTGLAQQNYCIPGAPCNTWTPRINSITFEGNVNGNFVSASTNSISLGCGSNFVGYSDFSNYSTSAFDANQNIGLKVEVEGDGPIALGVWVDFNNNNNFTDPGEFVVNSAPAYFNVQNVNFQIPSSVCHFQKTRIRVRVQKNLALTILDACTNHSNIGLAGETEDWSIQFNNPNAQIDVLASASGPLSFCDGENVTLTASGADNYMWNNGYNVSSAIISFPGQYYVVGRSNNGCRDTSNIFNVEVFPRPIVTINQSSPIKICFGDSITLSANGAETYVWSTGNYGQTETFAVDGVYNVIGRDSNDCYSFSNDFTINTKNKLISQPSDYYGEISGNAQFKVQSNSNNYQWQFRNNGVFQNINNTNLISGTNSSTLNFQNLTNLYHNSVFRCIYRQEECIDTTKNAKLIIESLGSEKLENDFFSITPNPALTEILIKFKAQYRGELKIIALNGRVIRKIVVDSSELKIDVSELTPGLYYLNLDKGTIPFVKL